MMSEIAGKLAGALALVAYIPYVIAILRKETRPNRASWCIWAVIDVLIVGSYLNAGAKNTLWVPVSFTIGAVVVALLSLKYGERAWSWIETVCTIGAAVSTTLWLIVRSPLPALLLNIAIVMFGAVPTVKKAYREPHHESRPAWLLFFLASIANLIAVERWEFAIWIFPVSVFIIEGTMFTLVFRPRTQRTAD